MYQTNSSNTGPVNKKTRWRPFVRYSIGWGVQYSNGIKKSGHLASNLFLTLQKLDQFGIQIPTVIQFYWICWGDSLNFEFGYTSLLNWYFFRHQVTNFVSFFAEFWDEIHYGFILCYHSLLIILNSKPEFDKFYYHSFNTILFL